MKTISPLLLFLFLSHSVFSQMVSGGNGHSLVLDANGAVWTCGRNNFGQLGDGSFIESNVPVRVDLPVITSISRAYDHSMAIDQSGNLWLWGLNNYGQIGISASDAVPVPRKLQEHSGFVMAQGGHWHTVALKKDGHVWAWGHNFWGELGNGNREHSYWPYPVLCDPLQDGTKGSGLKELGNISSIASVGYHTLALDSMGQVWSWGPNEYRELGHDGKEVQPFARRVEGIPPMQAVAAGWHHSIALDTAGRIWVWGSDPSGQIRETPTKIWDRPTCLGGLLRITKIVCGSWHSLATDVNGDLWGWGKNHFGMLGKGDTLSASLPVKIPGLSGIKCIGAACFQSMAVDEHNRIWTFGDNPSGQQGTGDFARNYRPEEMLLSASGILTDHPTDTKGMSTSIHKSLKYGLVSLSFALNLLFVAHFIRRRKRV